MSRRKAGTRSMGLRRGVLPCVAMASILAMMLLAGSAAARTVVPFDDSGETFNASGSELGTFSNLRKTGIDETNRIFYGMDTRNVPEGKGDRIGRFSMAGVPSLFSGTGLDYTWVAPSVGNGRNGFEVDNSTTSAGDFYAVPASGNSNAVHRFGIDGIEKVEGDFPALPLGGLNRLCDVAVDPQGDIWYTDFQDNGAFEIDEETSERTGAEVPPGPAIDACVLAIDSQGYFYMGNSAGTFSSYPVRKFDPEGNPLYDLETPRPGLTDSIADIGIDPVTDRAFVADRSTNSIVVYEPGSPDIEFELEIGGTPGGIAVDGVTHDAYVSFSNSVHIWNQGPPTVVPDVEVGTPLPTGTEATLHGTLNPDGVATTECVFQWGSGDNFNYPSSEPCNEGEVHEGSADIPVTANIAGLSKGSTYHYRLVSRNANGGEYLQKSDRYVFTAQDPPKIEGEFVDEVNSDATFVNATIDPEGGFTSYQVEYGTTEAYGSIAPETPIELLSHTDVKDVRFQLTGLNPATVYHYRVVASNLAGTTTSSADFTFRTFDFTAVLNDPCGNALARQQTGAALLFDCRAYELVSAANAGGYDVESDLIPAGEPFGGYPHADERVLYGVHNGGIPGTGSPTNFGVDPYVATRSDTGWSTEYVGVPADGTPSTAPFGSPLDDSSDGLGTLAFGGENLCDPCFGDGTAGIPVRMPDGSLVQGMQGSLDPEPAGEPAGYVGKAVSGDGTHLIFGSTAKYEPAGNEGSLTIYDRNLTAGTTQVASTMPSGETMTGTVAALDVSEDGSRVLIGKLVGTDAAGNDYYDLYMHVGTAASSVEVADTTNGVLFSGMSSDGSTVYFTTPDALAGDGDSSADLFRADVGGSSATVERVSTGSGAGDTDACDPVGSTYNGEDWNVVAGGPTDCSVLGIGGGGGVSTDGGAAFFLSPELLDAAAEAGGTEAEPNLYIAEQGSAPHFISTLESDNPLVMHSVTEALARHTGDFQATPAGDVAVFMTTLPLTGYLNKGHDEVFRYDAVADETVCVSCANTGAPALGDASLAGNGLSITDDGRVFFTTTDALVLRDTNKKKDAYQWSGPLEVQLISSGTSGFDSGLLSVTADGRDVYFFTRDSLAKSDANGALMKIYDARESGGFFVIPPAPGCAASDECHGPGTEAPPPAPIASLAGTPGNFKQGGQNCGNLARRAKKNSSRAKRLRLKARRSSSGKQSRALRRRAKGSAKKARNLSKKAKACRRSSRGNG